MSDTLAIVQWIGEANYSAVRRARIFPLGRTELDDFYKAKSKDIEARYEQALALIKT